MSKTFCNYPWNHIYVHTTGHQKICCMSEDNITKSNGYDHYKLSKDKILDCWNSEYMKQIRLKMIAGDHVENCKRCVNAEKLGLESMRSTINKETYINSTNSDGSVDYQPTQLELHFGNTCNLHCKMCSQQFSHMIGKEFIKMGEQDPEFLKWVKKQSGVLNNWTGELDIVYDWYKNEKIKTSIFDHVSKNVNDLTVIGGEPTIIKEFYELLEYCYKQKTLKDKKLTITTNMTNTNKNLTTWLGSVKTFMLHASIDGINERNKYIRYPCSWESVLNSLNFYQNIIKNQKNGFLSFAPAIQLLNIDQIDELAEFFINNFVSDRCDIAWVSQVRYPIICDYSILPTNYRKEVADKIESRLSNIKHEKTSKNLLAHCYDLRKESYTEKEKVMYQKMFIEFNDKQDKFRKTQSWRQLIPKLNDVLTNTFG